MGAATAHQTQPGSYSNLPPPHSHLVRFTSRTLDFDSTAVLNPCGLNVCLFTVQDYSPHSAMAADMNRGLPPMSSFHRNNTAPRTPSINTSENSTGDCEERLIITVYLKSYLSFLKIVLQLLSFLQSQGAREMCQDHRQAIPWAKLWPL